MNQSKYAHAVQAHYQTKWPSLLADARWHRGPMEDLGPNFCILIFQRTAATRTFATRCMSAPEDSSRLELHLIARTTDATERKDDLIELMTSVAHYHRTERPLGLGHTINFGRPWLPGSLCTYGLISLPYLDGPTLEWLDEPRVRFLWIVPITASELEFKRSAGIEALESAFEHAGFDYLDPQRRSVA